jgi:hypothetical protein
MEIFVGFITGVLVGFELDETDDCHYLHIELFIVQITFKWDK